MTSATAMPLSELFVQDETAWVESMAALARRRDAANLDWAKEYGQRRPIPQWNTVDLVSPYGQANYHGLDAQLDKRFARGYSLTAAYTWSHSIDNLPEPKVEPLQSLIDALPQRLAEELAYVGRLLESLGDDLCNEPLVVARHAEKLQNLDIASQILGHVAALLVTDQPAQAVKEIGMTSLRKRLLRVAL